METVNLTSWLPDKPDQDRGAFAVLVKNLFSKEECDRLVKRAQSTGFTSQLEQARFARRGGRTMIDDRSLAETIEGRLVSVLPKSWDPGQCSRGKVNTDHCRIQSGHRLKLKGINERLRFLRYEPGEYFHGHVDGFYTRDNYDRGVLTVHIYLNSGYDGGATRFLHPDCSSFQKNGYCKDRECQSGLCRQRSDISIGDAVIFQHDLWHQGSVLEDGVKYTCRTEVMYGF